MVEILRAGTYSTIQDLGRVKYRNQGIPVAGVMDRRAHLIANSILGNDPYCASLECCVRGPRLKFLVNTWICISGARGAVRMNNQIIENSVAYEVQSGDELNIEYIRNGNFLYLAVVGGFKTDVVLGSRSQFLAITPSSKLIKGDQLMIDETYCFEKTNAQLVTSEEGSMIFSALPGPEFRQLSSQQKQYLTNNCFRISTDLSRTGFKLDSEQEMRGGEISSSAIQAGTIQWTPSGKLVVMMRDCPVTGGYLRVLQLEEAEISRMTQQTVGSKISFHVPL